MDVFADEAGYSGTQLMNADAPVFVLATCSISNEDAKRLVTKYLPPGANELHFAEQYPEHLDRFIGLLSELKTHHFDRIFVNVAHKPFITLIKAFDFWIDCMLELTGDTLYVNRRNFALANMTYWGLLHECGQQALFKHLRRFLEMMNGNDEESYSAFWNEIRSLNCKKGTISQKFVSKLCEAEKVLGGKIHRDKLHKLNVMEAVLTIEKQALAYWSALTPDFVDYYHDQASEFAQQKTLWAELTSDSGEERTFKVGEHTYRFPLKMRKTTFLDSRNCHQIQLCDVIASAINLVSKDMFGVASDSKSARQLFNTGVLELVKDAVWPSDDPADWQEDVESEYDKALEYTSSRIGTSKAPPKTDPEEVMSCMDALKNKDYKSAFIGLKKLAERRNIHSVGPYVILGQMTEAGLFVKANSEQADEWYLKAIASPDSDARFVVPLHLMLLHGCNPKRFISVLERSARDGSVEAGYKMAMLYLNGVEGYLKSDESKAFSWAKRTAPQFTESQRLLAHFYHYGIGTKKNLGLAKKWYKRAAMSGDEQAFEILVLMELSNH